KCVEHGMGLVQLDEASFRQDAPHLCREVVPLFAVEVVEDREAAFQQVLAKPVRFAVRQAPESGLPHVSDRVLEEIGIVEGKNQGAVGVQVDKRDFLENLGKVLLGARIVVI